MCSGLSSLLNKWHLRSSTDWSSNCYYSSDSHTYSFTYIAASFLW